MFSFFEEGIHKSPSHHDKTKKSCSCLNLPSALFNHKINMYVINFLYDRIYPINIFIYPCINSWGCTATCCWTKTNNTYYCPSERNKWYKNLKSYWTKLVGKLPKKIDVWTNLYWESNCNNGAPLSPLHESPLLFPINTSQLLLVF